MYVVTLPVKWNEVNDLIDWLDNHCPEWVFNDKNNPVDIDSYHKSQLEKFRLVATYSKSYNSTTQFPIVVFRIAMNQNSTILTKLTWNKVVQIE